MSDEKNGGGGINITSGRDTKISDRAVLAGRDATVTESADIAAVKELFQEVYKAVDTTDSPVKEPAKNIIEQIEEEATTPDGQPNEQRVESLLNGLKAMAPDIFDVAFTTFANPPAGAALVIKKIWQKAKEGSS